MSAQDASLEERGTALNVSIFADCTPPTTPKDRDVCVLMAMEEMLLESVLSAQQTAEPLMTSVPSAQSTRFQFQEEIDASASQVSQETLLDIVDAQPEPPTSWQQEDADANKQDSNSSVPLTMAIVLLVQPIP